MGKIMIELYPSAKLGTYEWWKGNHRIARYTID